MPVARTAVIRGPALIIWDDEQFWSKGDIKTNIDLQTFEIMTSAYGKVNERETERVGKISFELAGEWFQGQVEKLWPYADMIIGASIFGTDKPLIIHGLDGTRLTFAAGAITKPPDLILSANKTLIGSVEFSVLGKDNTAWSGEESFLKIETGITPPAPQLDPSRILTQPYEARWGTSPPWAPFVTKEGFHVTFALNLQPLPVDGEGIIDYTFEKLAVNVRCQPVGITEADVLAKLFLQGSGAYRGKSIAGADDLVITPQNPPGGAWNFTLGKPGIKVTDYDFGPTANRVGQMDFVATRSLNVGLGTVTPLFAVSAPS